jgi:hypothetical protein
MLPTFQGHGGRPPISRKCGQRFIKETKTNDKVRRRNFAIDKNKAAGPLSSRLKGEAAFSCKYSKKGYSEGEVLTLAPNPPAQFLLVEPENAVYRGDAADCMLIDEDVAVNFHEDREVIKGFDVPLQLFT